MVVLLFLDPGNQVQAALLGHEIIFSQSLVFTDRHFFYYYTDVEAYLRLLLGNAFYENQALFLVGVLLRQPDLPALGHPEPVG